jgi:NADH-quinone oxidoreductase subunit L
MTPLAILAISAGWLQGRFIEFITNVLPEFEGHLTHAQHYTLIGVTSGIAIGGILFAVLKFRGSGTYFSEKLKDRPCYKLLANQYYIPHIIEAVINKPYLAISRFSWKEIDLRIVDTIVDAIAKAVYNTGKESRAMQTGNLSGALKWMVTGVAILLVLVAMTSLK